MVQWSIDSKARTNHMAVMGAANDCFAALVGIVSLTLSFSAKNKCFIGAKKCQGGGEGTDEIGFGKYPDWTLTPFVQIRKLIT